MSNIFVLIWLAGLFCISLGAVNLDRAFAAESYQGLDEFEGASDAEEGPAVRTGRSRKVIQQKVRSRKNVSRRKLRLKPRKKYRATRWHLKAGVSLASDLGGDGKITSASIETLNYESTEFFSEAASIHLEAQVPLFLTTYIGFGASYEFSRTVQSVLVEFEGRGLVDEFPVDAPKFSTISPTVNLYPFTIGSIRPYIGLNYPIIQAENFLVDLKGAVGFQAGLTYKIGPSWFLDFRYQTTRINREEQVVFDLGDRFVTALNRLEGELSGVGLQIVHSFL